MTERSCANYYPGEVKVTFSILQAVKQKASEDPMQFIKRFKDVSLDCYGDDKDTRNSN